MSFDEIQFPADISYGSSGGPTYATDIVISASGYEQRNISWAQARARYNVAHGVKTKSQLEQLIAFFRARRGRAVGFRFKDWTDYTASGQNLGTGDGVRTSFQLVKRYNSGASEEVRMITKPVSGSVVVKVNGTVRTSGITVDYTKGLVQFSVAPLAGQIVSADFSFDVPVRFDTDRLSATLDEYGVHSWLDIALIEVRG